MGGTTKSAPGSGFGEKTSSETFPQIDDSLGVSFFCILPVVDKIRLEKKKMSEGAVLPCVLYIRVLSTIQKMFSDTNSKWVVP